MGVDMNQIVKEIVSKKDKLKWMDTVHILTLGLMLLLIYLDKPLKFNNWGLFIGIFIFTFWTFITFLWSNQRGKEIYSEQIIFFLIFIGYTILSLALVVQKVGLISINTLAITLMLTVLSLYFLAITIWSRIFIKNKRNPYILVLSYIILTMLIIALFMIPYVLWGGFASNGQIIPKSNLTNIDYFYYSTIIFTNANSDYSPLGVSKLVTLIESYLAMLFNVVIIGIILSRFVFSTKGDNLS